MKRVGLDPVLLLLLTASLAVNVFLGVRLLRPDVRAEAAAPPATLSEGTEVPPIKGTADGKPYTLSYGADARSTVLYVFSETCTWCEKNGDNLAQLIRERGKDYRFVGLDFSARPATEEATSKLGLSGVLQLRDLDGATKQTYHLAGTPQTIVVSPGGKVLKHWRGAYAADMQAEVEQFFSISLPGLTQ